MVQIPLYLPHNSNENHYQLEIYAYIRRYGNGSPKNEGLKHWLW